jgi:hypothetical protein
MSEIIKLTNGLKFVVLSKVKYNNEKYLFVSSVTEELQFLFLKQIDDKGTITPVEDGELIVTLSKLVETEIKEKEKLQ